MVSVDLHRVADQVDITFLKDTLTEFVDKTGSEVATTLLASWPDAANDFVKVCLYY